MSEDRKIKLGHGYWLYSDPYCYWICKEYEYKQGKHIGETYIKRITGYYPTIQMTFEGLSARHTREIESKSINTLIKEIKSLKTLIKDLTENLK